MALLLTRSEVADLLDLDSAMAATEEAFREQSDDAVAALAPSMLPTRRGALRIVSGALLNSRRMGVRAGPAAGYLEHPSGERMQAFLYDSETGDLLCVMAYTFGTLRTGATVGVATRLLAREDAHVAAMLGTGRNAISLLRAVCHVRPIEHVRVYSRDTQHRTDFAERASAALDKKVQAVDSTEAASLGADVVCVATNSLTPVVRADQLSPGTFLATMGRPSEIDPSVYLAAGRIIVGHKKHEEEYFDVNNYPHQLLKLAKDGQLDWASAVHELCDVVTGKLPGRSSSQELVVFKESQGGFGDVAFCNRVYEEARKRGLGQEVDL